ncbi:MAG: hypothetical protein FWE61_00025 [Micrococcales bacterium]|nr:hypothetical protein [Micrococcales bacterium]
MRPILRFSVAAVLTGGVLVATAVTASADPDDPCGRAGTYLPGVGCVMAVTDVRAGCADADGYLTYTLSVPVPAEQVQITVTDGTRTGHATGGPAGQVAWPAEVTGANATVTFTTTTTPAYTASAVVATPECARTVLDNPEPAGAAPANPGPPAAVPSAPAPKSGVAKVLAATGAHMGPVAAVAAGTVLIGSLLFLASWRRTV